jgi:integrase
MLWSDIENGLISVTQNKTGKKLWIPMHSNLRRVLAEIPRVSVHVLANSRGIRWTTSGFKASWGGEFKREPFAEHRERKLVFHGLRKSAVVFLLEAGCTDAEVSAITGQSRGMAVHYARQVSQKRLAVAAVLKWQAADESGRTKNENEAGL